MIYSIKRFFKKISKIFAYLPILWKDEDYDWTYLLSLMKFKLSRMRVTIKNGYHDNGMSKRIKTCELLIDRLVNDDYLTLAGMDLHDRKWGELEWRSHPINKQESRVEFHRSKTPAHLEDQERKEFNKICDHETFLKNQDKEYLFNIMNRFLFNWWD